MTTRREYLTVAVGDTITLAGPVQVEFLHRTEGYRMGVASAPAGGELSLTGIDVAVFALLVDDDTNPDHTRHNIVGDVMRSHRGDPASCGCWTTTNDDPYAAERGVWETAYRAARAAGETYADSIAIAAVAEVTA